MHFMVKSRPLSVLLLAIALAVSACNGAATTTAGEVERVLNPDGFIDGEAAHEGAPLPPNTALTTNDRGTVQFITPDARSTCALYNDSGVTILDGERALLRHDAGIMACDGPLEQGAVGVEECGSIVEPGDDAIYILGINDKGCGVRVLEGTVDVADLADGETVVVDPGQTVGWTENGEVNPDWKIPELSNEEQALHRDMFGMDSQGDARSEPEPTQ